MNKAFLLILDGWGHGSNPEVSAIAKANTPYMDGLYRQYPHTELITCGEEVGLPEGQMGNSEVGHLNLGAGRIVYQELARINKSIKDKELQQHPVLLEALDVAKKNKKKVHIMGLLSDGGVHSHIKHLIALCEMVADEPELEAYIHAFTDGRDTDPKGGVNYIASLLEHIAGTNVQLATVIGRYYAMDRDNRWARVKLAYDLLVKGEGAPVDNWEQSINACYTDGLTDEFLPAMIHLPQATISDGDVVIFFNFRTDRPRELVSVLSQTNMPEHDMKSLHLHMVTFARYDERFENIHVVFEKEDIKETLGEVLSNHGKTQIRIAETEKYPHVTFFFNGGREKPFPGEKRILIPSPKVATYDLQPEMSAPGIKNAIIQAILEDPVDFICLNFANPDMVGHTGSMPAAIKAVECIDQCLSEIIPVALGKEYSIIIIADHGNADFMINPDGTPNTAHTTNPVPCILLTNTGKKLKQISGKLGDIAPTILELMDLPVPKSMDGISLLE